MDLLDTRFTGLKALEAVEQVRPLLTLTFYNHAVILRRDTDQGHTEYPVDPAAIATALAAKTTFQTGLLSSNTLAVKQVGVERTVIEYRPPQLTAIWLEGSADPIRVPLPGLIMSRQTRSNGSPEYRVYAVKQRPETPEEQLYHAPLPNVGEGGVCWGTVAKPTREALAGTALAEDWKQFLGSRFGNHSVNGKSKRYKDDIRKLYLVLPERTRYPLTDLVKSRMVMGDLL